MPDWLRHFTSPFAITGLVMATLLIVPAPAAAYCSEPTEPSCIRPIFATDGFADDLDFDLCKRSVMRYLDNLDEWATCEANEKKDEAVKRFNCRAQGGHMVGSVCFNS
jgi:hypothetical protein